MINIKYLCSGVQNITTAIFNSIHIDKKKHDYYRLSSGFCDANNSYEEYISKIV